MVHGRWYLALFIKVKRNTCGMSKRNREKAPFISCDLERQIVIILVRSVLGEPQDNRGKHEGDVLYNAGVTVVDVLRFVPLRKVLDNKNSLFEYWLSEKRRAIGRTSRTILPANPPAIHANPMNRNNLARHTARESPYPSSNISLLMMFTTSNPKVAKIPGTQSRKVTCTGTVS